MNSENENPNLSPYNNFMSSLTQKITVDEQLYETYQKKIFNINELQGYIETQEKLTNKELNKQIKINIGDGIFVDAIHPPSKTIILNIGLNYYAEIEHDKAKAILEKQKTILLKKSELLQKEIIKNKSYFKLTKDLSNQLDTHQKFSDTQEEKVKSNISSINI